LEANTDCDRATGVTLASVSRRLAVAGGGGGCDAQLVNAQTPNVAMVVTKRCIGFP
jgi:hypothetical protein